MPFKLSYNFSLFYEMEFLTLITQLDFKLMKDTAEKFIKPSFLWLFAI